MRRASHALAHDGGVWLVDPVDGDGLDELIARPRRGPRRDPAARPPHPRLRRPRRRATGCPTSRRPSTGLAGAPVRAGDRRALERLARDRDVVARAPGARGRRGARDLALLPGARRGPRRPPRAAPDPAARALALLAPAPAALPRRAGRGRRRRPTTSAPPSTAAAATSRAGWSGWPAICAGPEPGPGPVGQMAGGGTGSGCGGGAGSGPGTGPGPGGLGTGGGAGSGPGRMAGARRGSCPGRSRARGAPKRPYREPAGRLGPSRSQAASAGVSWPRRRRHDQLPRGYPGCSAGPRSPARAGPGRARSRGPPARPAPCAPSAGAGGSPADPRAAAAAVAAPRASRARRAHQPAAVSLSWVPV